jgi:hypothetical protein
MREFHTCEFDVMGIRPASTSFNGCKNGKAVLKPVLWECLAYT